MDENKSTEDKPKVEVYKDSNEDSIDLKKTFSAFKGLFKKTEQQQKEDKAVEKEDELSFDIKGAAKFLGKHAGIILLILALTVSIGVSTYIRMLPASQPYAESWAQTSIGNMISSDIQSAIAQQYPNLPDAQKNALISEEYNKAMGSDTYTFKTGQYQGQAMNINDQIKSTADYFKAFYRDPDNKMYLPDIDPYYWQRYAENIIDHGYMGDEIKNGVEWDNHQLAPIGRSIGGMDRFHTYYLAYEYKVMKIFSPSLTLRESMFWYPVIISALTVLMVFFIGRKISSTTGGFFAALMVGINAALLNRTTFGRADSDAWVVFFSVLTAWIFIEALSAKNWKVRIALSIASGLAMGVYSTAWGGWWYMFYFLFGTAIAHIAYNMLTHRAELKQGIMKFAMHSAIKDTGIIIILFFIASAIFVSTLSSVQSFKSSFTSFTGVSQMKDPVYSNLWPNVLTTVAELNEGSVNDIVGNIGGKFLLFLALMGIALTLIRQKNAGIAEFILLGGSAVWWFILLMTLPSSPIMFILLLSIPLMLWLLWGVWKQIRDINISYAVLILIWLMGTIYASTKGIRFTLMMVPPISLGFGVGLGIAHKYLSKGLSRTLQMPWAITSFIVILLLGVTFFAPSNMFQASSQIAKQDVPLVDDAWWDSLKAIESNSSKNAIITSWWDFGHHFKEIADRPVTFDGTTQQFPQAHWVGMLFSTEDEQMAMGILKMIDCGGVKGFDELEKIIGSTVKSIDILDEILPIEDKEQVASMLQGYGLSSQQVQHVMQYTHCEPPEAYVIASEDMIGKSGVWSHFGFWDFKKADLVINAKSRNLDDAVAYIQQGYNYTPQKAKQLYYELQGLKTASDENSWVSPWYSLGSGTSGCQVSGETVKCGDGLVVNLTTNDAWFQLSEGLKHPVSFVYVTKDGVQVKKYTENVMTQQSISAVLIPVGTGYESTLASPELASSMFMKLFYLGGAGLSHFKQLSYQRGVTGQRIYVWKVDWNGGEKIVLQKFVPKEIANAGDTVSVNYIGYLDDGQVFDSSISGWQALNLSGNSKFSDAYSYNALNFVLGQNQVIAGFENSIKGMKPGQEKMISIPPEDAYGSVEGHPLQNETLNFRVRLESIA
jgi:dolichyl-phosphooligosaccharide-protein glycotransferase